MALYRVTTRFTAPIGGPYINVLYFQDLGGTAQQAATAAGAFWDGLSASLMSNQVTWAQDAEVETISTAGVLEGVTAITADTGGGTSTSEALPPHVQALVRLRTGNIVSGRELRGRVFVPGMVEGLNVAGRPASSLITDMNAAAATLIGAANAEWMVWSKAHNVAHDVSSASTWTEWASQRRRRD